MDASNYRHTQIGWVILGSMAAVTVVLGGSLAAGGLAVIAKVSAAIFALTTLLFGWLTVEVADGELRARFGVGLIRKRIALSEVRSYASVQNPWYWGWGIRLYPGGWLYNVSGLGAVEVVLRDGARYRIGTDEPTALSNAIRAVVGEPEPIAFDEPAARPRSPLKVILAVVALVLVALGGVGFAVFAQSGPPTVAVTATNVSVKSGLYKVDVPLKDVTEVRLDASIPRILRRTNGFASGGSLRGHFDVDTLGAGQLFVDIKHGPFVFVRTADTYFYVSYDDPARTQELYESVLAAWTTAKGP
ncbi:MAG TPA: hypothetical protein VGM56_28610 [Byssovorax sp.]|jgi:hypothetical protein